MPTLRCTLCCAALLAASLASQRTTRAGDPGARAPATRLVPELEWVSTVATVMVPERRTRMETYTECRMICETVVRDVTVMVPHSEVRHGTRTICKPVPVETTKVVRKDVGHWDTKGCVDCYGCKQTCQVWMPQIVSEEVPVTVWQPRFVEEPHSYDAIVCRGEVKQITERVAKPVYETKTREVSYYVTVPKQVEIRVPACSLAPRKITFSPPNCAADNIAGDYR